MEMLNSIGTGHSIRKLQTSCTMLQLDNHASISSLKIIRNIRNNRKTSLFFSNVVAVDKF